MSDDKLGSVATVRAFNRLYTNRIGLLDTHLDGSPFTLSEARVLYELANRSSPTAAEIGRSLNMDRAQISRTLKRFATRKLIRIRDDPAHGRQQLLSLTKSGRAAFEDLNARTENAVSRFLEDLGPVERERLVSAARSMTQALASKVAAPRIQLRGLEPGDLGMVTARQAVIYADEYGWNHEYEVLVARILADFREHFDPARDAAWIAEFGGQMAGSIFLMRSDEAGEARLRLLYVEPFARGAGIGALLIATCIERAQALGYERLKLWTNSVLVAARSLYERFGFRLIDETPHHSFGHDLVGQTWSLTLTNARLQK